MRTLKKQYRKKSAERRVKVRVVPGDSIDCPRCGHPTEIREHVEITPKMLRQQCYYRRWYCCMNPDCRTSVITCEADRVMVEPDVDPETQKQRDLIRDQLTMRL